MATEHKSIPDSDLHEAKGAAAATVDQLLVADGAGHAVFKNRLVKLTASWSPSAVSANTTTEQTLALSGAIAASDTVIGVSKPTAQAGLGIVGWRVSADNVVGITFSNNTASPITPTSSQTYTVILYRA